MIHSAPLVPAGWGAGVMRAFRVGKHRRRSGRKAAPGGRNQGGTLGGSFPSPRLTPMRRPTPMLSPCLAAWLLAGLAAGGHAQEPGRKPRQPASPPPELERKQNTVPSLVKLPDDFVQYARLPEAARRPRLGVGKHAVALLYSAGDGTAGDLHLSLSTDEGKSFSPGVRLNAEPGTVLSWNRTQSGSIDFGPDDRVHVAWIEGGERPALRYVRTSSAGEPEGIQDLGAPEELGTTTALTVDEQGQVYLFYAAGGPTPALRGTPGARIWMRRSQDGTSFEEPEAIDPPDLNVSNHSDLAAHVDEGMGTLHV